MTERYKISSKKTTNIIAKSGNHALLYKGKVKLIGRKIGFDSPEQIIRYCGEGCIVPQVVVFHYGTKKEDKFYFEDNRMIYQTVSIRTADYNYLHKVYNQCAIEKCAPDILIERIQEEYTFKMIGS
jgi:hypothetical protein